MESLSLQGFKSTVAFFYYYFYTGLQEADKTSTFKSSLVSVTDWSGSSDI